MNIKGHLQKSRHKAAFIEIISYGKDLDRRVKAKFIELTNKEFNTIFTDLNLKDPLTLVAVKKLEAIGFFFSGLLPDYTEEDVLRLQYYNTVVGYDENGAFSSFAVELMTYIKDLDPKWNMLHA